jgi:hypothetical protein
LCCAGGAIICRVESQAAQRPYIQSYSCRVVVIIIIIIVIISIIIIIIFVTSNVNFTSIIGAVDSGIDVTPEIQASVGVILAHRPSRVTNTVSTLKQYHMGCCTIATHTCAPTSRI